MFVLYGNLIGIVTEQNDNEIAVDFGEWQLQMKQSDVVQLTEKNYKAFNAFNELWAERKKYVELFDSRINEYLLQLWRVGLAYKTDYHTVNNPYYNEFYTFVYKILPKGWNEVKNALPK